MKKEAEITKKLEKIKKSIAKEVKGTVPTLLDISYSLMEFNPQSREFKVCFSICYWYRPNSYKYSPEQTWMIPIDLDQSKLMNFIRKKWRGKIKG